MRNSKSRPAESGLSIVELLAAATLAALGLLSLAGVMVTTSQMREQAVIQRAGLTAAQSMVEQIRGVDPSTVVAAYDGQTSTVYCSGLETCDTMTVQTEVATAPGGLLSISVNTSWSGGGESGSLDFATQVYNAE